MSRVPLTIRLLAVLAIGVSQAGAQEPFGNPFASAEALRAQRGAVPNASLRLRYQTSTDPKTERQPGELVIDAAPDWVQVTTNGRRTLYDFHLGRVVELGDNSDFVPRNIVGDVAFRVAEVQNRSALTAVINAAGVRTGHAAGVKDRWDACDAETELGVVIPGSKEPGATEVKQSGATATLECNGRVVGVLESRTGEKAPAALWPALAHAVTMHPALRARMAEGGSAPQRLEASFTIASTSKRLTWSLVSAEPITAPYPLDARLVNASAASLNATIASLGDIAAGAVAGRTQGGPPTLAAWEAFVERTAREEGAAAAVFAMWPALNMFPQAVQACQAGGQSAICASLRDLRSTVASDPAARALLVVAMAEQARKPGDAIAAMVAARASPHADHPALGAAFALALLSGGEAMRKQAQAAGLPSDAKALHIRAVKAYPYNPAYWTDLGDYFARAYELPTAYLLYDVAFSLPMPEAQRGNVALSGKRTLAARLRQDFPAFFLPK